jgi:hypothetical protein
VPRLERLTSTVILGYAVSEANGRFSTGTANPRARRGQLPEGDLPGHHALAKYLDEPTDWDAEFEADLADLTRLIASYAVTAGTIPSRPAGSAAPAQHR